MAKYYVNGFTTPTGVTDSAAVKQIQQQLNANGANLAVDGVWGAKTQAAYDAYNKTSTAATGTKVSDLGLQTGHDSPAWYTDEWDRQTKNAQQYANAGINYELKADPYSGLPSITYAMGQDLGEIEADLTGGTYDYYGMSNNPNYLQATIGLTREQVDANEILKGISDKALATIYNHGTVYYNPITGQNEQLGWLGTGLWYNPAGSGFGGNSSGFGGSSISSFKTSENSVSVDEVRAALAELTGQKNTYAEDLGGWWGGTLVPFVKTDYYGDNTSLGARQQSEIIDPYVAQIMAGLASSDSSGGSVVTTPTVNATAPSQTVDSTKPSAYDDELARYIQRKLTGRLN